MNVETTLTPGLIDRYTSQGFWQDKIITDFLDRHVAEHPEKEAVYDGQVRLSYGQLGHLVDRAAAMLYESGIRPGDAVALQLPNWHQYVYLHLALTKLGAITTPLMPVFRAKELRYILDLTEATAIVIPAQFRHFDYRDLLTDLRPDLPALREVFVVAGEAPAGMRSLDGMMAEPWEERRTPEQLAKLRPGGNDLAVIMFTSGTESEPKGVMHTHNTAVASARGYYEPWQLTADDVVFMASPVTHATGLLVGVRMPIILGARTVLLDIWNAERAVELIARERCTFTMGATPFLHGLANASNLAEHDLSSLRIFACGGAPIPRDLVRQVRDRVGCAVCSVYGLSESPPHTVTGFADPEEKAYTTDGRPSPGVEIRVVDDERRPLPAGQVGEEASRGPCLFVGYFKRPQLTASVIDEEGWFYSGDLCTMDDDGYIRIVGRKKDMIIRGGTNISPREVEEILFTHPKVLNVAIVGMPDERLGERCCAYVVPREGESIGFEEIVAYLRERNIATYKLPERLEVVAELPTTPSGKIRKAALRDDIRQKLAAESASSRS